MLNLFQHPCHSMENLKQVQVDTFCFGFNPPHLALRTRTHSYITIGRGLCLRGVLRAFSSATKRVAFTFNHLLRASSHS